jgi:hypothetical protein
MASDKSMYWLAAVVLAFGIGSRYGHGTSPNAWVACARERSSEILHQVTSRPKVQSERTFMVVNRDLEVAADERAEDRLDAAITRAQCRAAAMAARREAVKARMQAALVRVDDNVMRISIDAAE